MPAIVFNLTVKLSSEDAPSWIRLMRNSVLPSCTDGKIISSSRVSRIVTGEQDGDESFAVQFTYPTAEIFQNEKLNTMREVLGKIDEQFGGRYVYFATMMEVIHLQE